MNSKFFIQNRGGWYHVWEFVPGKYEWQKPGWEKTKVQGRAKAMRMAAESSLPAHVVYPWTPDRVFRNLVDRTEHPMVFALMTKHAS